MNHRHLGACFFDVVQLVEYRDGRYQRARHRSRCGGPGGGSGAGSVRARSYRGRGQFCIGQGGSSHNSEVIHVGLCYAPGLAKARLCVRVKELLCAFCASHEVPHRACGRLIVATAPEQHAALADLARRAQANGVPVRPIVATKARAREPELFCAQAL